MQSHVSEGMGNNLEHGAFWRLIGYVVGIVEHLEKPQELFQENKTKIILLPWDQNSLCHQKPKKKTEST